MAIVNTLALANTSFFSDAQTADFVSLVGFARPADTTAYAAGDVMSDSTSTAAQLYFQGTGRSGQIISAHLILEQTTQTADFDLYIFDSGVTDHLDNAPLALVSADLKYLVHKFTFLNAGKVSLGGGSYYEMDGSNRFQQGRAFNTTVGALYGLLVVRGTPAAPVASSKVWIRLSIEGK